MGMVFFLINFVLALINISSYTHTGKPLDLQVAMFNLLCGVICLVLDHAY